MNDPKTNKFKANFKVGCDACEQKPTVDVVNKYGDLIGESELCGPCYFGEASMIDMHEWDGE